MIVMSVDADGVENGLGEEVARPCGDGAPARVAVTTASCRPASLLMALHAKRRKRVRHRGDGPDDADGAYSAARCRSRRLNASVRGNRSRGCVGDGLSFSILWGTSRTIFVYSALPVPASPPAGADLRAQAMALRRVSRAPRLETSAGPRARALIAASTVVKTRGQDTVAVRPARGRRAGYAYATAHAGRTARTISLGDAWCLLACRKDRAAFPRNRVHDADDGGVTGSFSVSGVSGALGTLHDPKPSRPAADRVHTRNVRPVADKLVAILRVDAERLTVSSLRPAWRRPSRRQHQDGDFGEEHGSQPASGRHPFYSALSDCGRHDSSFVGHDPQLHATSAAGTGDRPWPFVAGAVRRDAEPVGGCAPQPSAFVWSLAMPPVKTIASAPAKPAQVGPR